MTALVGNEIFYVQGVTPSGHPAATTFPTTTAAVAALAAETVLPPIINTAISTVGAGTLTAAGLVGGIITRTGPVAAYSDATATALQIVAALTAYVASESMIVRIKNATAFTQTITAGVGVTLTGLAIIPAFSVGTYLMTITSTTAVTLLHVQTNAIANDIDTTAPAITALTTVGAGTITAAGIVGCYTSRGGSQSATPFTDTTDTAASIIAAQPGLVGKIGDAFVYTYINGTNALATLTGGTGVTVSGITAVPAGMTARYLITYTAAATLTMVGVSVGGVTAGSITLNGSSSGETTITPTAAAGTTTLTLPAVTGTVSSTTGANLFVSDVYRNTGAITANANVVPAAITGLSGAVAVGTYRFRAALYTTIASGTAGIAINQVLTTAVLSACNFVATGVLAAGVACQATTTATSGTVLYTSANQPLLIDIEGTFTVSTAGTFGLQMCQNTSNASNSVVNVGSYMELTRIA